MLQASKKFTQFPQATSGNHPLIDIGQDAPDVATRDNLNRANSILVFTQGFACNDKIQMNAKATAGLYWAMECVRTIIHYEAGHNDSIPKNPVIETDAPKETMERIRAVNALIQQMYEIDTVDKWMCEGMGYLLQCVDHAIEYLKVSD
jgi:hypothetical protein